MTLHEAYWRVARIWGLERIRHVRIRPDGGADLLLHHGDLYRDALARFLGGHRLDADGRPTCHGDCRELGEQAS